MTVFLGLFLVGLRFVSNQKTTIGKRIGHPSGWDGKPNGVRYRNGFFAVNIFYFLVIPGNFQEPDTSIQKASRRSNHMSSFVKYAVSISCLKNSFFQRTSTSFFGVSLPFKVSHHEQILRNAICSDSF